MWNYLNHFTSKTRVKKYQREELKETRKEFVIQNSTLKYQRFENTFFNLLSLHHQIVSGIDEIEEKKTTIVRRNILLERKEGYQREPETIEHITINGRDVFKKYYIRLLNLIQKTPDIDYLDSYKKLYQVVQTDFGHYFRNLYRIIKFIDETDFHEKEVDNYTIQYKYTSMVRAQLSDYELLWIFYNCLSENGIEKFKPYIEKYTLLKNMPKDKVHDKEILNLYKETAFKRKNYS